MKIALAQYSIGRFASFKDWQANAADWVARAAGDGAKLLSFPEYGGMELTSLLPESLQADLQAQIQALETFHGDFIATYVQLARQHGVFIQAPSLPVQTEHGIRNRAYICGPSGQSAFQEKRQMTRFEKESWGISGAADLKIFDIGEARIGIAICYDIEFPLIAHAMAQAGADLILAPSCTDTIAGSHRVHVGARARALENQIYVGLAPTVGLAPWSPAVDVNTGWAALYSAPDRGFPDDGTLARGIRDASGWVMGEADFAALRAQRGNAQVFTARDWPDQSRPGLEVVSLPLA